MLALVWALERVETLELKPWNIYSLSSHTALSSRNPVSVRCGSQFDDRYPTSHGLSIVRCVLDEHKGGLPVNKAHIHDTPTMLGNVVVRTCASGTQVDSVVGTLHHRSVN